MKKFVLFSAALAVAFVIYSTAAASHRDVGKYLLLEHGSKIVKLTGPSRPQSGGTGFELRAPSGRTYTITNGHVCELAENGIMAARPKDTDVVVPLRIIDISETTDLCILEGLAQAHGFELGNKLDTFDEVFVIGHPLLHDLTFAHGRVVNSEDIEIPEPEHTEPATCSGPSRQFKTFTHPIFGPFTICIRIISAVNTSTPIYPGNSGSPALNADGEVVGVFFAADGISHAGAYIPLRDLRHFISVY